MTRTRDATVEIRVPCSGFAAGCACWSCLLRLQRKIIKQHPPGTCWSFTAIPLSSEA
jgi:hypothetical protein